MGVKTQRLRPTSTRPPTVYPEVWNHMPEDERAEQIEKFEAEYFPKRPKDVAAVVFDITDDDEAECVICDDCECRMADCWNMDQSHWLCLPAVSEQGSSSEPLTEAMPMSSGAGTGPTTSKPSPKTKSTEHFQPDPNGPKNLVIEFCCSDQSIISQRAKLKDMQGIRLSLGRGDLYKAHYFESVVADIKKWHQAGYKIHLWGSVPCTVWSAWQRIAVLRKGPSYKKILQRRRRDSRRLVRR